MRKNTITDLVSELEGRNVNGEYDTLIDLAKKGTYHCFKSEDVADPKVTLVNHLTPFHELDDIRAAVKRGDYDEMPDEEDKHNLAKSIREAGDGKLLELMGLSEYGK